ncbi:MAG: hypothetical protein AAAB36_15350 [Ensifer adhaerens]
MSQTFSLSVGTLSAQPSAVEKASRLAKKFESDPTTYKKWVDATFPYMGHFLRSCGCEGRITVRNEASEVLQTIEPASGNANAEELVLIRSDDYRFRLASSSSFETASGVMTLFKCLATHLEKNGRGYALALLTLLYSFDYFTTKGKDCP